MTTSSSCSLSGNDASASKTKVSIVRNEMSFLSGDISSTILWRYCLYNEPQDTRLFKNYNYFCSNEFERTKLPVYIWSNFIDRWHCTFYHFIWICNVEDINFEM